MARKASSEPDIFDSSVEIATRVQVLNSSRYVGGESAGLEAALRANLKVSRHAL